MMSDDTPSGPRIDALTRALPALCHLELWDSVDAVLAELAGETDTRVRLAALTLTQRARTHLYRRHAFYVRTRDLIEQAGEDAAAAMRGLT